MTVVAVLGGGAGGFATTVDLMHHGCRVRLWNRRAATLEPLLAGEPISFTGVLGSGRIAPNVVTTNLAAALDGADVAVLCQPAVAHEEVFAQLAQLGSDVPLVLNPGHTGGALHARAVYAAHSRALPPVAEFSTLTYVARKPSPGAVAVTGKAGRVHAAALPKGEAALHKATELFAAAEPVGDVLDTSLSNVNMVLHPPGAVLSTAWVEATGGEFTFYVQGMTDSVVRVIRRLDDERLTVGSAFGHALPSLLAEMSAIGTIDSDPADGADLGTAIRSGRANADIKAPSSLEHRYYREDFPYGLVPFIALARIAGVPVPVAETLLRLGELATGERFAEYGLTAERLAIAGCTADALRGIVRGPRPHPSDQ